MTKINILYFASLADAFQLRDETLNIEAEEPSVHEIKSILSKRGSVWLELLADSKSTYCAVNQHIANNDTTLKNGDELAFFPPVTGG